MAKAARTRIALDEDVRPLLARLLRDRDWDALTVADAGRTGLSDEDQLSWATDERRVLLTHNAADYARMAASWARAGREHAGILITRQGPIGWLLREVLAAIVARPWSEDWMNQIVWAKPLHRKE